MWREFWACNGGIDVIGFVGLGMLVGMALTLVVVTIDRWRRK